MRRQRWLDVVCLVAMTGAGCAAGRPSDAYFDEPYSRETSAAKGLLPVHSAEQGAWSDVGSIGEAADRLRGRHAARLVLSAVAESTVEGLQLEQPFQIVSYALLDVQGDGAELQLTETPCFAEVRTSEESMSMEVAVGAAQRAPATTSPLSLDIEAGTWARGTQQVPLGWTPAADDRELPSAADDPRVGNPDGDELPGLTVRLRAPGDVWPIACRAATVQTLRARYADGQLTDRGLGGSNVVDEGSAVRALPVDILDRCPDEIGVRLTGPHRLSVGRVEDGAERCTGWTLSSFEERFTQPDDAP